MYIIIKTEIEDIIVRSSDYARIPKDELNIDYQKYLQWLSKGNQPEPWES